MSKRPSGWPRTGRVSPRKGAKRLPERVRQKVLKEFPYCWLRLPGICTGKSEQVHHVLDAADGGTDDPANLRGVCRACHTRHSAQVSQKRATESAWDWKRKPEKHPGVLD